VDVSKVFSLATELAESLGDLLLRLGLILGPFPLLGYAALEVGNLGRHLLAEARVLNEATVRVGDGDRDSEVDGDGGDKVRFGHGVRQLAHDVCEPLVHVSYQGAGLRLPLDGPVQRDGHVAKLREAEQSLGGVEPPYLLAGLLDTHGVAPLRLEVGLACLP